MEQEKFILLIIKELKSILKNRVLIFNIFFLILLVLFIGFVYQKGALDKMNMVIADLDQTSTSRMIVRHFADNEKFQVSYANDYPSVMAALKKGQALAGLVIPPGLSDSVKNKKGAEILLLIDGTNYIAANSAYSKANEILYSLNAGIVVKTLEGTGILPGEAEKIAQVIKMEQKVFHNPGYNYAYYLDYGVCGAGVFSLSMSAFALSLCRNMKKRIFAFQELAAAAVAFFIYISIMIILVFAFMGWFFNLPVGGSFSAFFALSAGCGLLITVFGIILFFIAGEEGRIFQLSVFFATTLMFTTGYTWPLQSLSECLKPLYFFNPLTPFLNGARACLVMGVEWAVMEKYILWQFVLVIVYLIPVISLYKYRNKLKFFSE